MRKGCSAKLMTAGHEHSWSVFRAIIVSADPRGVAHMRNLASAGRYAVRVAVQSNAVTTLCFDDPSLSRKNGALSQKPSDEYKYDRIDSSFNKNLVFLE